MWGTGRDGELERRAEQDTEPWATAQQVRGVWLLMYSRHGNEGDGEESLELPVVGSVRLGGRGEGGGVVDGSLEDG